MLLRLRRTAYAWLYLGDAQNPYTLFDLTAGRSHTFPQAFLAGYRGFVHAGAYDGYNAVHNNLRHLGCWMHARRYFVEAGPSDPRAVEALASVRTLYAVEREIKDEQEKLGDRFADADVVRSLVRYRDDARFTIDNGKAERAIRPLTVGRGNWLHVGGDGGLKTASVLLSVCASATRHVVDGQARRPISGVLLSVCASATRHRLNPWSYPRDVFDQLATRPATADVNDLLPDTWAKRQSAARWD